MVILFFDEFFFELDNPSHLWPNIHVQSLIYATRPEFTKNISLHVMNDWALGRVGIGVAR